MAMSTVTAKTQAFKHGNHIFVYSHIRTNQVIYSLTRSMKNNTSLKQLPFLGKKTVPAALRKDLWHPLCLLEFPNSTQGLSVFRKLREFRRLHETSYPLSTVTQTEGIHKGQLLPKKKRGYVLMNQKANSVADMAAVLLIQAREPTEQEVTLAKWKVRTDGQPLAKRGKGRQASADALTIRGSVEGVRIRWADILDAEYAETWPIDVVHDGLEKHRYTAAWPQAPPLVSKEEMLAEEVMGEDEVEDEVGALQQESIDVNGGQSKRRAGEEVTVGAMPEAPRPSVATL
ncbi:hypothetical protein MMC15_004950 [Xylographa vitiligo]|nr:hypothetical protein [Xylographa vitiligo]